MENKKYEEFLEFAILYQQDDSVRNSYKERNGIEVGGIYYSSKSEPTVKAFWLIYEKILERLEINLKDSSEVIFYKLGKLRLSEAELRFVEQVEKCSQEEFCEKVHMSIAKSRWHELQRKFHRRNIDKTKIKIKSGPKTADDILAEMTKLLG